MGLPDFNFFGNPDVDNNGDAIPVLVLSEHNVAIKLLHEAVLLLTNRFDVLKNVSITVIIIITADRINVRVANKIRKVLMPCLN